VNKATIKLRPIAEARFLFDKATLLDQCNFRYFAFDLLPD
jgi:hypothetical protein